jgi:hypothetical protein
VAKKKGDFDLTVPKLDLSLNDLPDDLDEKLRTTYLAYIRDRDRRHLKRLDYLATFSEAKASGSLAGIRDFGSRRPAPENPGPKLKFKRVDLDLIPVLIRFMTEDNCKLKTAIRKAEEQGLVKGLGVAASKVERVARTLKEFRASMEKEAQAWRNK